MAIERTIRRDIKLALFVILLGFTLATSVPLLRTIAGVNGGDVAGQTLAYQTPLVESLFLVAIAGAFLSFVLFCGYRVLSDDWRGNRALQRLRSRHI